MTLTKHADVRMRQRGLTIEDLELVANYGERVAEGAVMTGKALDRAQHDLKRKLQRLDHLKGLAVIHKEDRLITAYRADKRRMRRLRQAKRKPNPGPNMHVDNSG